MLKTKNKLLLGVILLGSLLVGNSMGSEEINDQDKPDVHLSADSRKKSIFRRQEKKPRMDRESALTGKQTLKSARDLGRLLWEVEGVSKQEKRLITLGELTLDIPKEDYKKITAWYASNKHISALRIPSYLIMQNFFVPSSRGQKTKIRYDLNEYTIADISKWLDRIARSPKPKGMDKADTVYNILSIHNATQEQADEILKIPALSHLGGIRIWLRPVPSETRLSNPHEGEDKKNTQIEEADIKGDSEVSIEPGSPTTEENGDKKEEEAVVIKEGDTTHHSIAFDEQPIELLTELKKEGEERETEGIAGKASIERFAHLHQIRLKPTLVEIANRKAAFYRRLLTQPHLFDLNLVPVRTVLNLLRKAHKYSQEDNPIEVSLKLHNITRKQLDSILDDENADYIGNLEWEYREGGKNMADVDHLNEHPPYLHLPDSPLLKKREAPPFEERVFEKPEEQQDIEPRDAKEDNKEPQKDKEEPVLLNWEKTTLKDDEPDALGFIKPGTGFEKPQDGVLSSNPKALYASQNLVRIYCGRYRE